MVMDQQQDAVLSVREAVAYMDEHYHGGVPHLATESTVRRWLKSGTGLKMTRTPAGHLGITVHDLRAALTPPSPHAPGSTRRAGAG